MSKIKKIALILLAILTLILIGGWVYYASLKPVYDGTVNLKNSKEKTDVYFDDYGVPHIYAQNQEDAVTALGYVHAQDRLWQMELMRRIAPGRLSELFGNSMLKNDVFFASLGIDEFSEKSVKNLDKKSDVYKLATAYLSGVNQFIDEGPTPIEFTLVGLKKEPYQLKDIYNILGYMSFSFAMAHKTDPLLSSIREKLGNNYIKDLGIDVSPSSTLIKNSIQQSNVYKSIVAQVHEVMNTTPISSFEGSNSWVISPEKTATGKVLFANDPHIEFAQPAVWYEAHISTPNYEMYGYHLAGIPFPLLGHNRNYAYGLTMFENDDIDFYLEENHPIDSLKYKTPIGNEKYTIHTKNIKVKDEDDVSISIKNSRHGPIVSDIVDEISETNPVAMSWIYTKFNFKILKALHTISRAKNMEDVKTGASLINAPGLNVMYGDAKGNVAWWAAGKLYKHKPHVNRKFILNGTTGEDDPVEYLNFNENPMAENPAWNYVYSANNQPDSIAGMLYPGYYLPEDRAKRIVHLLESKNNWTKSAMASMINDNTSSTATDIIKEFTNLMDYNSFTKNEQRAIDILQLWDGSFNAENVAPTIYNKWIYLYLKHTFEDELGTEVFSQLLNTHLMKRVIANHIKNNTSVWWDNIHTTDSIETKKHILSKAMKDAVSKLESQLGPNIINWQWSKVHTLEHQHPLGMVASLKFF